MADPLPGEADIELTGHRHRWRGEWPRRAFPYDLQVTLADGSVKTPIRGLFIVIRDVTDMTTLLTPIVQLALPQLRGHRRDPRAGAAHPHAHLPPAARPDRALVRVGTKAKVTVTEREDYVGDEVVATDATGRPVQSVITERDDGQDVAVYAPAATASGKGY